MRINRRVFVFAISAGMIMGVIRGFRMFLPILLIERYGFSSSQSQLYLSILSLVLNIPITIMLFIALYRLGKRIDMRSTYVDVSASLFIGYTLAHYFGYFLGSFINPLSREWIWALDLVSILKITVMYGLSQGLNMFFLGFTAIALSYFRNREEPAEGVM